MQAGSLRYSHLLFTVVALALGGALVARAGDSLLLKDGSALEGEVIETPAGSTQVVLDIGSRKLGIARAAIRETALDQRGREEYQRRAAGLRATDAQGHFELAQWCRARKLFVKAEAEFRAALAADPAHVEARQALGLDAPGTAAMAPGKPEASVGDSLFIANAAPVAAPQKDELAANIKATANVLGDSGASEESRQDAIRTLLRERERAADTLLSCLDFRKVTEPSVRLGALKGLRVVKAAGPRVPPALAWSAVMDPQADVRAQAVEAIKERHDDTAVGAMMRHLLGAFDDQGNVINAPVRDAAITALRSVGDRRVGETLLYYCTMEVRASATEFSGFTETNLIVPIIVSSGGFALVYTVVLPLQFPEIGITRVRTTVCCPASALRALTGQDFGDDTKAWLNWIRSH